MATYVDYEDFNGQIGLAVHNLNTNTLKAAIHSDAPVVGTDDELADLTQITGTGYTAGGEDTQNTYSETGGTGTLVGTDITWTGGAGGFTAGRYVSTHNDDSTTDKLINYWDYGGNFTVAEGETFTLDFGASWLTVTHS